MTVPGFVSRESELRAEATGSTELSAVEEVADPDAADAGSVVSAVIPPAAAADTPTGADSTVGGTGWGNVLVQDEVKIADAMTAIGHVIRLGTCSSPLV